jgi:hypothetical protein
MSTSIRAKFKKDSAKFNGLDAIDKSLLDDPLRERLVICKVRVVRIVDDIEGGGVLTPVVSLTHIEVMASDKEENAARKLFETACKHRLGDLPQQTLFDPGDGGDDDGGNADAAAADTPGARGE